MVLTSTELSVLQNSEFLKTKVIVIAKLTQMLEEIQETMTTRLKTLSNDHSIQPFVGIKPKISRGENYKSLPFLVLDLPRYFKKNETCAIRSMILWGTFVSVTLHISGQVKNELENNISQKIKSDEYYRDFSLCVNSEEWEHHFEEDNYLLIKDISTNDLDKFITGKPFLKIAKYAPIDEIGKMKQFISTTFGDFLSLID